MRAAIYARVSTDDGRQDTENQLRELRTWCQRVGHEVVGEYVDHVSGTKDSTERPQLAAMLTAAHQRKIDLTLVWALDRLSREGAQSMLEYASRLHRAGVQLVSYSEPILNTSDPRMQEMILALWGSIAAAERDKISARTRAGLARTRAQGTRLGRPALAVEMQDRIASMAADGASNYRIAKTLGIDPITAKRYRPAA
jgi:DNA invertase Pin-like site-specific DNA recombinase